MEIRTVKYVLRKNLGNYEHSEITLEASLAEGENADFAIVQVMATAKRAVEGEMAPTGLVEHTVQLNKEGEPAATATFLKGDGEPAPTYPAAKEEKPKAAPRSRKPAANGSTGEASAPTLAESANTKSESGVQSEVSAPSTPVEAPKPAPAAPKGIVLYDVTVKEHRSRLATYLGVNHPSWKTAKTGEQIGSFSKDTLNGKPFEDNKGNMLESFKAELKAFFG